MESDLGFGWTAFSQKNGFQPGGKDDLSRFLSATGKIGPSPCVRPMPSSAPSGIGLTTTIPFFPQDITIIPSDTNSGMGGGQEQQPKEGGPKGGHGGHKHSHHQKQHGGGNKFHHKKPHNTKFFQGDRGTKRGGGPDVGDGHAGGGEGPANKVRP